MKKISAIILIILSTGFLPKAAFAQITETQTPVQKNITFTFEDKKFVADAETVSSWQGYTTLPKNSAVLEPEINPLELLQNFYGQGASASKTTTYNYDPGKIFSFINSLSPQINQAAQEPELVVENGHATGFAPPKDGQTLDSYDTVFKTLFALSQDATSVPLSVSVTKPQKSLAETNNLGINELVGHGVSSFKGSPKNRIHNIHVGVDKMTGIIVPQGGEFSFDDNLGPVEAAEGFLPELVIKGDKGTIPEFGGGLCQVSTTTFRAAMDAGLPITARRNHSYAVQYYAPQGTDATIYPGSADLKFINDTPGEILIWPYFTDATTLVFDIYGTKDSRKTTLEKPVVYDRKADGSMKATWTRLVEKDGQVRTDVFKSSYQPPALFHKTESFVSATGTATSGLQMPKTN